MGNIQVLHLSKKSSSFLNRKAEKATFLQHAASEEADKFDIVRKKYLKKRERECVLESNQ